MATTYRTGHPACCTSTILTGLFHSYGDTPEKLSAEINKHLADSTREGFKVMQAITVEEQSMAAKALKACGFTSIEIDNHKDVRNAHTKLTLWHKQLG